MTIDNVDAMTRFEVTALLSCLQAGVPYQSRVSRIMRTISEAVHFVRYHSPVDDPKYRNSTELKRINFFVSRGASLLIAGTQKDFEGDTILEHPLPMAKMYLDLKSLVTPTSGSIIEMLGRYPLITVTRKEDRRLKDSGWTSPAQRYTDAEIEVGHVKAIRFGTEAEWKPISLSDPASWCVGGPLS